MEKRLKNIKPSYNKNFMKPSEVAVDLGICYETVLKRIKAGEIKAIRVGSRWRIPTKWFVIKYDR